MKSNKKKKIENEEDDDYIIDNDQEILDYQNNSNKQNKSNLNKNNKIQKESNKNQAGNWIKEAKAKYQRDKNTIKNNTNKIDSRISNNNRKPKKIVNYDDIPVGGGMGGGGDFSVEIRVPQKKNNYIQNNSYFDNNIQFRNEANNKNNIENKTDFIKSQRKNNYFEENNTNNVEHVEMERKSSMASMITQNCDKEMLGRSEFIGIPMNQNSNEMNFSNNDRINNNKSNYSLFEKQEDFSKISNNNIETSNFSNKISDYNNTKNLREKTESAIQLQNVQRELDNEIEMNKRLQGQIENYKSEFNNLREELVIKSDIINELQQKISKLEKELFLQRNQLIEAEAKPSQEHYEDIINNYENMKKNFDKAIDRIKYLSDENAELKEKLMMYEGNNKKIKRDIKSNKINKEKMTNINNPKKSKRIKYMEKNEIRNENEEEENPDEENEEDINEEQENNKIRKNIQEENIDEKVNNEEEEKEENKQEKGNSIIPEDNDIFGTKNYGNQNKNIRKPRKIQEDGIPVIKRVEERDNVKDIMVNNYTANDDIYYNRPPIGKPKVKRMKRNNDKDNNLNNYQEQNKNTKTSQEYKKNEEEVKNNDKSEISNGNENITNNKRRNNKNNISTNSGVFPSQLKSIANEREILNLESQLFNLQKERDLVNDEYLKYPEYPKKREEINAKRKIEMKLEEMNKEISLQKLKIRELKVKK